MNTKKNKIAGAIFGFAIGDSMGATTEFMNKQQISKVYGSLENIVGGGWLKLKPGEVTDDTQMTCCVMEALIESYNESKNEFINFSNILAKKFISWLDTEPKDVGNQCMQGIIELQEGRIPCKTKSAGNGSLMRALPCALLGEYKMNKLQGIMTHNNDVCTNYIEEYTLIIQNVLKLSNFDFKEYCKINRISSQCNFNPTGYVVNTFYNAVKNIERTNSFEEAIIMAVNDGGDADTIAAITGSIAGAIYGFDSIPKRWLNTLDNGCDKNIKITLENFINFANKYLQI